MKRLLLLLGLVASSAVGQAKRIDVAGGIGYATFLDESDQSHVSMGGAARFYVTPRNAIEPEMLYLYRSADDKDLLVQGNFVRDLGRGSGRAVPYAVGGGGRQWGFRPRFTESTWTASGGLGVRMWIGERFFVSPEIRLGLEPILRAEVRFGWSTGRRQNAAAKPACYTPQP